MDRCTSCLKKKPEIERKIKLKYRVQQARRNKKGKAAVSPYVPPFDKKRKNMDEDEKKAHDEFVKRKEEQLMKASAAD